MANIFQKIVDEGMERGLFARLSRKATAWFQNKARTVNVGRNSLLNDPERAKTPRAMSAALIGNLYYFTYDPKGKKTLPYYDNFPIVLVTELKEKGFLGINFHYLGPKERGLLLDVLLTLGAQTAAVKDDVSPESKEGKLARRKLHAAQLEVKMALGLFKPTLKHYLFDHIKSRMIQVPASEWDIAIFLPVAKFVGADARTIHAASLKAIRR